MCASIGTIGNRDYVLFTAPGVETFDRKDYKTFIANIKLKASNLDIRFSRLVLEFLLDNVVVSSPLTLTFSSSSTEWQNISLLLDTQVTFFK